PKLIKSSLAHLCLASTATTPSVSELRLPSTRAPAPAIRESAFALPSISATCCFSTNTRRNHHEEDCLTHSAGCFSLTAHARRNSLDRYHYLRDGLRSLCTRRARVSHVCEWNCLCRRQSR